MNIITVTMKNVSLVGYLTVLFVFTGALEITPRHHDISADKVIEKFTLTELVNSSSRYGRAYSGDNYLDEAQTSCLNTKRVFSCFKYKALRYLHKLASPSVENTLASDSEELRMAGGMIHLVGIPESMAASEEYVKTLFPDSQPRSSDSELERLYKFTLRQAERFVRTHALALRIPTESATNRGMDAAEGPRIVDEDNPQKDLQDDNTLTGRHDVFVNVHLSLLLTSTPWVIWRIGVKASRIRKLSTRAHSKCLWVGPSAGAYAKYRTTVT